MPILYMHHVEPIPADILSWTAEQRHNFLPYVITPCELSAQLDYLVANGYTTILPRDLAAYWDHHRPLPGRPVILTFDDGYSEWTRTILPILQARGLKAEFYLTVDHVGSSLTWTQVRSLVAAGMGIGAHDVNHIQLTGGIPAASLDVMRYQVDTARQILTSKLGVTIDSMAYVGGGFDSTLIGVVRAAGFTTARAILRGITQSPGGRYILHVSRIGLYDDVVDKTIANVMACDLVPGLPDYQKRLDGSDPG